MRWTQGTVTVVGRSMWPLLQPGDRVSLRPIFGLPSLGTILVYAVADRLVVHRLVRIRRREGRLELVLKGDLSQSCDAPIELARVLGKAVRNESRGFPWMVDHRFFRAVGWLVAICAPTALRFFRAVRWCVEQVGLAAGRMRRAGGFGRRLEGHRAELTSSKGGR